MILVNNPGSWSYVYPPLAHAEWHGWTPTDLVFPFFLFAVGLSMVFSFSRRRESAGSTRDLQLHVLKRGALIILIGLLLNGFPRFDLATIRIPGVLQRIGVVYLVAATAWLHLRPDGVKRLTAALLLGYWAAMMLVPIPGVGVGSLTKDANVAQYLDSLVLTGHMWQPTWDPEGILSTVPAVATCLLGALAGDWIRGREMGDARRDGVLGLFVSGTSLAVLGWIWGAWFPVNKNLWTSSYVLLTGGLALLLIAWLIFVIEIKGRTRWTWPFVVYGSNALLVFVLTGLAGRLLSLAKVGELTLKQWMYEQWFASWAGALNGSLAFAIAFVLFWLVPMAVLYRRGLILRI